MPEYLQKIINFFKNNKSAKDLLIGSIGAVIGAVFDNFVCICFDCIKKQNKL